MTLAALAASLSSVNDIIAFAPILISALLTI
jgi:hypothetical protein